MKSDRHFYRLMNSGLLAVVLSAMCVSCSWRKNEVQYVHGKTPLVEINGDVLYEEDIRQAIPLGLSYSDSVMFADRYITNWAQDVLFYQNAIRNVPDTRDIDRLVENYRRSLFEHEYQRRLVEQKFSQEITDDEISRFYYDNQGLFLLDESLVKGLFLKISNKSHDLDEIRKLYTMRNDESYEEIEKYSIRNAARCDFFYDKWHTLAEIEVLLPATDIPLQTRLDTDTCFEFKDEDYIYLLNVSQYAAKGAIEPLDHASNRIRGLLINSNEVAYMRKIKEDLYSTALERERIIFHKKK